MLIRLVIIITLLACQSALAQKSWPRAERTVVGDPMSVSIRPNLDAVPEINGRRLWVDERAYADASFVKAHVRNLNLKPGDTLTIRSASGKVVETLSNRGPKDRGTFWSLSAFGNTMRLELDTSHTYDQPPFEIDQVIVGHPGLFTEGAPDADILGNREPVANRSICSPADFEDVMCYQSDAGKWANVQASVGVMSVGGNPNSGLFCSGSNISATNRLLTNQHCIESQAQCDGAEFVFRYYRTGCNDGSPPTMDWVSYRCDQVLASSPFVSCDQGLNDLDYTLATVIGDPASTFGFATPDPNPLTDGEDIYIVQHPAGRPHEITHGGGTNVDVDGTVLRYYDTLDTEGGSSGSPIYRESDDQLIGLHHCGGCSTPGTGNRGMLMSDIYNEIAEFLCTQSVSFGGAGSTDPVEVTGNGDAVIDPGESWSFMATIRNEACADNATGVTGTASVDPASTADISIPSPAVDFGDIDAGQTATSSQPIVFDVAPATQCGSEFSIDLTNLMATGRGGDSVPGVAFGMIGMADLDVRFSDDFSSGLGAWTIVDGGTGTGPAQTWTDQDPDGRGLLTPPFVIADSDAHGDGNLMDEELISPVIDASGATELLLEFNHNFRWYNQGGDEQADVDVLSSATGGTWTNVANYSGASTSGFVSLDITAFAAADLQIRFHYYQADFDWWWAVDDVTVVVNNGFLCEGGGPVIFGDSFELIVDT